MFLSTWDVLGRGGRARRVTSFSNPPIIHPKDCINASYSDEPLQAKPMVHCPHSTQDPLQRPEEVWQDLGRPVHVPSTRSRLQGHGLRDSEDLGFE